MDDYLDRVTAAAAAANGKDVLHNRTSAHAAVIITALFRKATASIQVVCEDLNDSVYGNPGVIAAALGYLNDHPAGTLEILVENAVLVEKNAFLRRLRAENLLHRVVMRIVPEKFRDTYKYNFMLADHIHYRYEPDRVRCEAVALFGNAEDGEFLKAAFESFKAVSPEVALA
jgi:hypothetical protein